MNQGANSNTRDSLQAATQLPPVVCLPKDDALHGTQPLEWYYWVGHLRSREGQLFGFHEVFFIVQTPTGPMVVSNLDLTDITNQKHHYSTTVQVPPFIPSVENGFLFRTDLSMAFGGNGRDYIGAQFDDNALNLVLISKQKPVLHHGDGYIDYPGGGGYSYYYSRERLVAAGLLTIDGRTHIVEGTGWFDHQWGDIRMDQFRWMWFGIQLDDHREIMVAALLTKDGVLLGNVGTYTDHHQTTQELASSDISIVPTRTWTSPVTGFEYPTTWNVTVLDTTYVVQAQLEDQEMITPIATYWEGPCTVQGGATGIAYAETTH